MADTLRRLKIHVHCSSAVPSLDLNLSHRLFKMGLDAVTSVLDRMIRYLPLKGAEVLISLEFRSK